MAAEALLVNGATEILKKLSSTVAQEIGGAWGVKKELEKLKRTLETIQAILQDAEKQQSEKEAVRLWLRRLKDLALDADNLLDEFAYEDLRGRVEIQNHLNKRVRRFFSRSNRIAFRFEMAHKIRHINELLAEIKGDASGFQLQVGSVDASPSTQTQISRETHSFVDDSEIVGRSKDKSAIIEMLIDSNNQEALSVIPIVGLGGMGKTTLAQSIYNDESVVRYFDKRIWVYVSEIFDVKTILSKILDSVTISKNDIKTTDLIIQSLQQNLSGRSLLLVLDDVWNEDNKQWEELKAPLRFGVSGGKIIVTTRSNKAASIMTTVSPYHLEPLSKEDTWSLFKKRAFRMGGPEETPDLVEIGMEIVNKCGGVPLAAMSVGSLMYFKKEIHEWSCVLSSETWKLPEDRSGILPALKLSYDHLPSPVKQCFAYCSIFAKGFVIEKKNLIQLWNAQGLLQPSEDNKVMDDIGDAYFNYLILICFFQNVQGSIHGDEVTCSMHDLVVDLARFVARPEFLVSEVSTTIQDVSNVSRILHLIFPYDRREPIPEAFYKAKRLRSFFWVFDSPQVSVRAIDSILLSFKHLRVLNLSHGGITELSSSIGKLKHLRYLDLSENNIKGLPESITNLYNLQTLRLNGCYYLERLPKGMTKLVNLIHLEMDHPGCLTKMPFQVGQLKSLQRLPYYFVGSGSGYRIDELQHLPLEGTLTIFHLQNVKSRIEAAKANLRGKTKINKLHLYWVSTRDEINTINDEDILEGLEPHQNLKALVIDGFKGINFPRWTMDMSLLGNLVEVDLRNCSRCQELPMFGELPYLKILKLTKMNAVENFGSKFYDRRYSSDSEMFPSLEVLELWDMLKLVKWIEVFPAFRCLKRLCVSACPELKTIQTQFPSLQEFILQGSNDVVLRSMSELNSLTSLEISRSPEFTSIPQVFFQNMSLQTLTISECLNLEAILPSESEVSQGQGLPTSLETLLIWQCPALMSLPDIQGLQSLRILRIVSCKKLMLLPNMLQGLIALEELTIGSFSEELDSFPGIDGIEHLSSLQTLKISGWPKLLTLPEQLQHLSTLKFLRIYNFDGMVDLPEWLGNLSQLQILDIQSCPNLMYLPSSKEMRRLTALQKLDITDCPLLKKRCKSENEEEWHKLAHIPSVNFWKYDHRRKGYAIDDS